ncbi:hypothetical protein CS063_07295 [Sporanaerobium hydrogeniformans]|uniref:Uncharacterized protein n=1 Tax=Sporanaerobium hydrogeniformans TaxID=3072179 RepID=A0AC61DDZ4_9FIRM|nr:peptidoglycan editing factor PgeF [Sporanaerobium hydrogeniformans]PHV71127.1 hypothetical protein CS063_07295 [Sporanaerobium hydrogeniformans]
MNEKYPYRLITNKEVTYLQFSLWEKEDKLVHGFTTRHGGVSTGILASLNLGFNRGDDKEKVYENYQRVCKALEVECSSLVLSKQVHETHIEKVTEEEKGNGFNRPNKWESVDGLYTRTKGVTLVTHFADCVPLFFYAPGYDIVGMAHAGWRGTVGQIGRKMVELWVEKECIPLSAIQVAIGPSIGPCCFEVDKEVADIFKAVFGEEDFIQNTSKEQKYNIDLWACNKQVLMNCGILEHNIVVSKLCTCCHDNLFFSHRKTKGQRGTLGGFMALKD